MPVSRLTKQEAQSLTGIIFDLDDTVLTHGVLLSAAHDALFRAHKAGLHLILATGRPAGWADVLLRILPLHGAIAENGAVVFWKTNALIAKREALDETQRTELNTFFERTCTQFGVAGADDNELRRCDRAFDINEKRTVPEETVANVVAFAHQHGFRTLRSSIHLHVSCDGYDKASGLVRLLGDGFGYDATVLRKTFAFVGDSANDAACFGAFALTVGVANVRSHLARISVAPRYITAGAQGAGFTEFVTTLLSQRL